MSRAFVAVVMSACAAGEASNAAPLADLDRDPAACAGCHAAEAASWRASRHAASFVDGAFHAELEPMRSPWCTSCHAPLATEPAHVRDQDPLARAGVACAACHVRDGELVASRRAPNSPHATRSDPSFASGATMCAACHQFNFPVLDDAGRLVRMTELPMQATVAQAEAAGAAACLECHDPHRIPGAHDPEMLARGLAVSTCRDGDGTLRILVGNAGAGHNLPTGGVDRHLVLRAWRSRSPERMVSTVFGRTFVLAPGGGKRTTSDTTLAAGETRTIRVDEHALGGERDEPINVELRYVFAADEHAQLADTEVAVTPYRIRAAASTLPVCREGAVR